MAQWSARLRRACYDQVVFSFPHFAENLTEDKSMPHPNFRQYAETLEALPLREQVAAKLGAGPQKLSNIFLEPDEIGVNGRRFRHHVQESDRCAYGRCDFSCQLNCRVDVILPAGAN